MPMLVKIADILNCLNPHWMLMPSICVKKQKRNVNKKNWKGKKKKKNGKLESTN